jgi:hypothetical protein
MGAFCAESLTVNRKELLVLMMTIREFPLGQG